jgi:hypothetical protein
MEKITMTRTTYELKEGTKGAYKETKTETREVDRQFHKNFTEAAPFFRRLGGSETLEREYTCRGYNVTKVTSKSPDRQKKIITTFKFE